METERKTLHQRLLGREIRRPNYLIYQILVRVVVKRFIARNIDLHITRNIDVKEIEGPFIVVCNHASRLDYIYASLALLPRPLNYVVGYNEFFRSHLRFIFRLMQCIPKKNFVRDVFAVRAMKKVLDDKGAIALFPEGMSSISGTNQPSALGSGKLLRYFGVPVVRVMIRGGYFVSTKYNLDERGGKVEVELDLLFTPEDLCSMTDEEAQLRLDEAIRHDEYEWNKERGHYYDGKGQMAKNLHTLLFRCPKCGAEFEMRSDGSLIECNACGNAAHLDESYGLTPAHGQAVIPANPRVWYDEQRRVIREWVKDENFELREKVKIGVLPEYEYLKDQKTSEIAGEGELWLCADGLHFEGQREGKPFSFFIQSKSLPTYGMCTDVSRFYTFVDGEFIEFYPERETTAKWFL
ncbi:MAG: 1-acyl-sn-glycerol-3-phosphate acyltransferase, partial [Clostridiales Family XIII bacterium]|nr:1-acyl-sn-glycerol-3-phosphate acyltransferase [Clostridiales Family XIII bacterium]